MRPLNLAFVLFTLLVLTGCGSKRLDYNATAPAGMTRASAERAAEQGFYEDYGKTKAMTVSIQKDFILISDGLVSKGSSIGMATGIGPAVIGQAESTTITREAGQRIYFNSLGKTTIHQKRGRDNRFIVVLRASDQGDLRHVSTRSLAEAERFANAIEFLRQDSLNIR